MWRYKMEEETKWRNPDLLGISLMSVCIVSGIGAFLTSPLQTHTKLTAISILSLLAAIIVILGDADGSKNTN